MTLQASCKKGFRRGKKQGFRRGFGLADVQFESEFLVLRLQPAEGGYLSQEASLAREPPAMPSCRPILRNLYTFISAT